MEIVSSIRRKNKIINEGHIYVFQKDLANNLRSFECELRRKGHCKARIKVDPGDEIVGMVNEHTHPPSAVKVEVTKLKNTIKDRAEVSQEVPQNVLADKLGTASAAAVANLPCVENMKRTIRSQRREDHPPNPIARAAIPELPQPYQNTLNNERFLLFDSGPGDDNRILVFATDQATLGS